MRKVCSQDGLESHGPVSYSILEAHILRYLRTPFSWVRPFLSVYEGYVKVFHLGNTGNGRTAQKNALFSVLKTLKISDDLDGHRHEPFVAQWNR